MTAELAHFSVRMEVWRGTGLDLRTEQIGLPIANHLLDRFAARQLLVENFLRE
jgi:hypothetical protein